MGVTRFVARALLACALTTPLLAAPAVAQAGSTSSGHGSADVAHHSADVGHRASGVGRLHPPATIHLIAARVYWNAAPPAYPSTRAETGELRQASAYFERISRGRERFHWTLTPWVHVNAGATTMCQTQAKAARVTRAALAQAGYRLSHYNRLMIVAEQCHAAFSMGAQPGQTTWIRYRDPGVSTIVHELGHNLGLDHAYALACTQDGRRVALSRDCRAIEYGDDWDAMGHATSSYSVPVLRRLGWAGRIATVRRGAPAATYRIADVEHSGSMLQGVRVRLGAHLSYWIEYQPHRGPVVGRAIPGVTIRRDVGTTEMQLVDASPGNPSAIGFPDRDLENPALPVGSSLTTPEHVRISVVSAGRTARVRVAFDQPATAPAAPVLDDAAKLQGGGYRLDWTPPADNGQIVLGYRITALPSGATRYVRSPAGYRTSVRMPRAVAGDSAWFTVEALNQRGWSPASAPIQPVAQR